MRGRRIRMAWLVAVVATVAVVVGCGRGGERSEPPHGAGMYTIDTALELYDEQPERALRILDSARILGHISDDEAALFTARMFSWADDGQNFDSALHICQRLMNSDFVEDNEHHLEMVLDLLVSINRMQQNFEQYMYWAAEKVEFCLRRGDDVERLRTEAEIGNVMTKIGDVGRGLEKLDGIIASLEAMQGWGPMDACIIALKRKINALIELRRYEEVWPLARRMLDKLAQYRQHPERYADGSYRMPADADDVEKYCDFYSAQAHVFMARVFAMLGMADSARLHLSMFDGSYYAQTLNGRLMAAPAWCRLGMYAEMDSVCVEAVRLMGEDTVNETFAEVLRMRAREAEGHHQWAAASGYWRRYALLNSALASRMQTSRTHDYAARYRLQEEEAMLESERVRLRHTRQMLAVLVGVLLAVLGFAMYASRQRRASDRRNRVLVEQIAEGLEYKRRWEATAVGTEPDDLERLDDAQLYAYLGEAIRRERLFLKPDCGRQTLVDRFHVSERRIGAAFAQGGKGSSLPEFVRDLRLEYACRLLVDMPNVSIGEVAEMSGFSSLTVFGRDFKRKYEVTPTFYRNAALVGGGK